MMTRRATLLLSIVAAALCAAGIQAQSADDKQPIRITAVVTNAKGETVASLKPADFHVAEDGVRQDVDAVEFRKDTRPRVFGIILDEFHIAPRDTDAVRAALLSFVDQVLREGDRVAILKPLESLSAISLLSDREEIRQAIRTFSARQGDYAPRTPFEQKYLAQAPQALDQARAQIVISALRAMVSRISEIKDTRTAVLLVSDGFPRMMRNDRDRAGALDTTVRLANRGDVAVHVLAPGTPSDRALTAMRSMASDTGGTAAAGIALDVALASAARHGDAHYMLTFTPSQAPDGRFRTLSVSVTRPGTTVLARAGYQAPLSAQQRAALESRTPTPVRTLRRSTLIQTASTIARSENGDARVAFSWEKTRRTASNPRASEPALLNVKATTPEGTLLFEGNLLPAGANPAKDAKDRADFIAPPGRVFIDVLVFDAAGKQLDTDSRDVEVPDLKRGPVLLAAAVHRASSEREFRALVANPLAAPTSAREFRRTERLLIRVPAYEDGKPASVAATLLNRIRQPMRALEIIAPPSHDGISQFELPLAPLPPGDYAVRLSTAGLAQFITFRVTG